MAARGELAMYPTPKVGTMGGCSGARKAINNHPVLTDEEKRAFNSGDGTGQLNPNWVEWLMGWPVGFTNTQRDIPDWRDWLDDPADHPGDVPRITPVLNGRRPRIRMIGNGQVPLCAAAMQFLCFTALAKLRSNQGGHMT